MEDWQGCLSPICQTALQNARSCVLDRGGVAISVEDFLLALIDYGHALPDFLQRRGIDLDELTRTIQCEQPVVTAVNGEGMLASQLQYWFALASESSGAPWLTWPHLLRVLVEEADRLAGKAYVTALEPVTEWPVEEVCGPSGERGAEAGVPVVVTDSSWLRLAEDISVITAAQPRALVWLVGPPGAGKSAWLQAALLPMLDTAYLQLDLRREADVVGNHVFPVANGAVPGAPLLILDNTSPADALALMSDPGSLANHFLPLHDGPILLLSADQDECPGLALEHSLGRRLERFCMPVAGPAQQLAILTAHQPEIERRWQVELDDAAIRYVAPASVLSGMTPGEGLQWLSRAAARIALIARRGPLERQRLEAEAASLNRELLVAIARQQPTAPVEQALDALAVQQEACEAAWSERQAAGHLRRVMVGDLRHELTRWSKPQADRSKETSRRTGSPA